jgi:hypothetical protein
MYVLDDHIWLDCGDRSVPVGVRVIQIDAFKIRRASMSFFQY